MDGGAVLQHDSAVQTEGSQHGHGSAEPRPKPVEVGLAVLMADQAIDGFIGQAFHWPNVSSADAFAGATANDIASTVMGCSRDTHGTTQQMQHIDCAKSRGAARHIDGRKEARASDLLGASKRQSVEASKNDEYEQTHNVIYNRPTQKFSGRIEFMKNTQNMTPQTIDSRYYMMWTMKSCTVLLPTIIQPYLWLRMLSVNTSLDWCVGRVPSWQLSWLSHWPP